MTIDDVTMKAAPGAGEWIDVSVPLHSGMVHWPGDPAVNIERVMDIARGDSHTLSAISMGSHTGTHMDAPLHFNMQGAGIDRLPLDITIGPARVIEIKDSESIKVEELSAHNLKRGERILFKTRNSQRAWGVDTFTQDFVFISGEAAGYLAGKQIKLVGIDYLSVGGYKKGGAEVHRFLLNNGVWIIEGLDLSQVSTGNYFLVCLPLKIAGGDGAPARAILKHL